MRIMNHVKTDRLKLAQKIAEDRVRASSRTAASYRYSGRGRIERTKIGTCDEARVYCHNLGLVGTLHRTDAGWDVRTQHGTWSARWMRKAVLDAIDCYREEAEELAEALATPVEVSPSKLAGGGWGVRHEEVLAVGQAVTVVTRSGKAWGAVVTGYDHEAGVAWHVHTTESTDENAPTTTEAVDMCACTYCGRWVRRSDLLMSGTGCRRCY